MRIRCRPSWALVALGLTMAACGTAEPDRFSLRTPGANTGDPNVRPLPTTTPAPSPTPTPTATPKKAKRKPVSPAEKRVIKGWSDSLRRGRVAAAARYFSVPSLVSNSTPGWLVLDSSADVRNFNRTLPCGLGLDGPAAVGNSTRPRRGGAKLPRPRRSSVARFVVGIFRLTERPGAGHCGTGTGNKVAVAFMIRKRHIKRWVRDDSLTSS